MTHTKPNDPSPLTDHDFIHDILSSTLSHSLGYLAQLHDRDDRLKYSRADHSLSTISLSATGIGTQETISRFESQLKPSMVAATGANYWGFVTGGTTPASIAGDWLTSVYDANAQTINGTGDISGQIEVQTIDLLKQLLGLPTAFFGSFVTGATMANFTGLAVARQWAGQRLQVDIAQSGMSAICSDAAQNDVCIYSATPHSSTKKALAMLGFGRGSLTSIPMLHERETMDMTALEKQLCQNKKKPIIVIASAGTVNTGDFDDFEALARLKTHYQFWLHIDAAFGAFAALSDTHAHLTQGWHCADSITMDCHKWLNVPYDSAVIWVHDKHKTLQHATFNNSDAPYLGDEDTFNYLNFVPENSRRLRALPVWFSLIAYGKDGIKTVIDRSINNAQSLADFIGTHPQLVLLAPMHLNNVCFAYQTHDGLSDKLSNKLSGDLGRELHSERTMTLLQKINASQKVFMTPTWLAGRQTIRASFVNWRTTTADVEMVCALITQILNDC